MSQSAFDSQSSVIAKCAGKDKFLDFRNNMIPANPNEACMLQGVGGKDHAPNSTITVAITDYSQEARNGNRGESVFVSYNLEPYVLDEIYEVCKENISVPMLDISTPVWDRKAKTELPGEYNDVAEIARSAVAAHGFVTTFSYGLQVLLEKYLQAGGNIRAIEVDLKNVASALVQSATVEAKPFSAIPISRDFLFECPKVQRPDPASGLSEVQTVKICRSFKTDKNQRSSLPWAVKIENFKARPIEKQNGTRNYDASSQTDYRSAWIMVDDNAMYRAMFQVSRFLRIWDDVVAADGVRDWIRVRNAQKVRIEESGDEKTQQPAAMQTAVPAQPQIPVQARIPQMPVCPQPNSFPQIHGFAPVNGSMKLPNPFAAR